MPIPKSLAGALLSGALATLWPTAVLADEGRWSPFDRDDGLHGVEWLHDRDRDDRQDDKHRHRRPFTSRSSASTTTTATCSRRAPSASTPRCRRRSARRWAVPSSWPRYVAQAEGAEPAQRGGRRRRLHRRVAADLGAVLRRARGRDAEPHRPRLQRGRQPRVRQGLGRAAAPAERRLQVDQRRARPEQLQGRCGRHAGAVRGREIQVAVGQRGRHRHRPARCCRAYGIKTLQRRAGRVHRHDAEGHADASSRRPAWPAWSSATRPTPSTRWCRSCARRASRRSSCWCTRAASRRGPLSDINGCDGNLAGSRHRRRSSARLDDAVDLVVSGHTHAAYNCSANTVT